MADFESGFDYIEPDGIKQKADEIIAILNDQEWEEGKPFYQQYGYTTKNPMPSILQYIGNIIALMSIHSTDLLMTFSSNFSYHYKCRDYLNHCSVVRVLPGESVVSQTIPDTGDIVVVITIGSGSVTIFNYKEETYSLYIPANSVYALRESAMYHTKIDIPGKIEDDVNGEGIIQRETQYILTFSHVPIKI